MQKVKNNDHICIFIKSPLHFLAFAIHIELSYYLLYLGLLMLYLFQYSAIFMISGLSLFYVLLLPLLPTLCDTNTVTPAFFLFISC